jgi:RNA polymerase sigma factor for flagellar operon FliA
MKNQKDKAPAEEVKQWWESFKANGDEYSRNRLLEHYLPIVKYTAERLHQKLPDEVDVDDLISSGIFGLMDAVRAFDLTRGVKFETYCAQRIRGAILDELRSLDWVPRLVRSRASKLNAATSNLEAQLGRKPTNKELAKQMGLSMKDFRKLQRDANATSFVSLSRKWFETDSNKDVREIDVLEDTSSQDPIRTVQRKDLKELITRGLSRAERLIVILYYFEEMTMKEIGETLDLSESRVSQMHSAIMERLRVQLDSREKELEPAGT